MHAMTDRNKFSDPELAEGENSSDVTDSGFAKQLGKALRKRKRKSKPNYITIRLFVSNWNMQMVEKHLQIKFKNVVRGTDVLTKGGIKLVLTEKHENYKKHLHSLLDFSESLDGFRLYASRLETQFASIKEKVLKSDDFKTYQRSLLFFIELLDDLRERASRDDPVFECRYMYTELVSRFAEVCLLMPYADKHEVYFKTYPAHFHQVKREDDNTEICRKKLKLDLQSSSSEDREGVRPTQEDRLKGQHVGKLLLDLHSIVEEKFGQTCTEYSMPGLIIDGTRVSLSMLVISKEHYEKLKDGRELDKEDEAFVYRSAYYNILLKSQRNDLIELFLYLDNMPESFINFKR